MDRNIILGYNLSNHGDQRKEALNFLFVIFFKKSVLTKNKKSTIENNNGFDLLISFDTMLLALVCFIHMYGKFICCLHTFQLSNRLNFDFFLSISNLYRRFALLKNWARLEFSATKFPTWNLILNIEIWDMRKFHGTWSWNKREWADRRPLAKWRSIITDWAKLIACLFGYKKWVSWSKPITISQPHFSNMIFRYGHRFKLHMYSCVCVRVTRRNKFPIQRKHFFRELQNAF